MNICSKCKSYTTKKNLFTSSYEHCNNCDSKRIESNTKLEEVNKENYVVKLCHICDLDNKLGLYVVNIRKIDAKPCMHGGWQRA